MSTNNAINTPQITLGGTFTMSGAFPFTGTLTGTTNVTFPQSGTLATTSQVYSVVDQTTSSVTMSPETIYINDAGASLVTYTLPTTAAIGTSVRIVGKATGGWKIAQGTGQSIQFGNVATTVGVGGSLQSTNTGDSIELVCNTANTTWTVVDVQGNITFV